MKAILVRPKLALTVNSHSYEKYTFYTKQSKYQNEEMGLIDLN